MRRYFFLLVSISLLIILSVPMIVSGKFTFAFDMGRDLLWVRNMVELKKPTLIGPWGSIAGVYFGPIWYYLLSIPYILFNGDPRGAVIVPLAANVLTIVIGWMFLRRSQHKIAADIFAILYSVSPLIVSLSSFAFHANLLPLTTLIYLIGLTPGKGLTFSQKKLNLKIPLAALMASVTYHLEPASGVMLTLFMGIWIISIIWKNRHDLNQFIGTFKLLLISAILFIIPFIPQLIFELRHNFIQTKSLAAYFSGENTSLGGILPLNQRLIERVTKIAGTLSYSALPLNTVWQQWLILAIFLFLIVVVIKKQHHDQLDNCFLFSVFCFLLFHYLAYTFLFPAELKGWYLNGFAALFLLSIAIILEKLLPKHRTALVVIIIILAYFSVRPVDRLFNSRNNRPAASETLSAQLATVDWVYADALEKQKPFSVYTYTPPIYDYTWQYLLWWRGTRKYQILPAEYAYQQRETTYLPDKEKFVSASWRPEDTKLIYLIIEPGGPQSQLESWLGNFSAYPQTSTKQFSSGIRLEVREISAFSL